MILENSFDMGGLEKKLFDLLGLFDKSHFEIIVCCLKDGGYFKDSIEEMGIRFYDGLLMHKYDGFAYRRLARIINSEKIELLYSFLHPNAVIFSFLARSMGRIRAWVLSIHAMGSSTGGRLVKPYLKPFLGRVDRFIAVAHTHKDYLVDVEGLPKGRIDVIYNGVDVGKYHPGPPNHRLAVELGMSERSVIVTTIASLKPAKCLDVLLHAASEVVKSYDDTMFLIIGDGPERENLQSLARKLGLEKKIVFTGTRDDVHDLLRVSSLFVLPSRRGTETFPNVLLEAMATGLPVVSTDVGSVREMVEDGASAYVVPPENPEELVQAISRLLQSPKKMKAFGERGREIVNDKFTLDGMRSKREELFSDLLCAAR
jgi:glycosyltransferase involved in cell wall biosynthesis